jgi:hypothetical protein
LPTPDQFQEIHVFLRDRRKATTTSHNAPATNHPP